METSSPLYHKSSSLSDGILHLQKIASCIQMHLNQEFDSENVDNLLELKHRIDKFSEEEILSIKASAHELEIAHAFKEEDDMIDVGHGQICCKFYEEHSCALLASSIDFDGYSKRLFVVGLFECVQGEGGNPGCKFHIANSIDFTVDIGECRVDKIRETLKKGNIMISKVQGLITLKRHLCSRGPKFISKILRIALKDAPMEELVAESVLMESSPTHRYIETCCTHGWPLVQAVFSRALSLSPAQVQLLSSKTWLRCELAFIHNMLDYLAENAIKNALFLSTCSGEVDQVMKSMAVASKEVDVFAARGGFDVRGAAEEIAECRAALDRIVRAFAHASAKRFVVEPTKPVFREPQISKIDHDHDVEHLLVSKDSMAHLSRAPLCTSKWQDLLVWVRSTKSKQLQPKIGTETSLLIMSTVKDRFVEKSKNLGIDNDFGDDDLAAMKDLVMEYQGVLEIWLNQAESHHLHYVTMRSHELLVVWTAACVAHSQVVHQFPLVRDYRIPMDWKDLSVLVLDDARDIDAACCVAAYIRSANEVAASGPIFHLCQPHKTVDFAGIFCDGWRPFVDAWKEAVSLASKQRDEHWKEVEDKMSELKKIRSELREAKGELDAKEREIKRRSAPAYLEYSVNLDVENLRERVRNLEQNEHMTRFPPAFIKSPLPKNEAEARVVLFFLNKINIFSQLSLAAQTTLVPRLPWAWKDFDFDKMLKSLKTNPVAKTWMQHYESNKLYNGLKLQDSHFKIYPQDYKVPASFGPKTVEEISNSLQCMWYPSFPFGLSSPHDLNPYLVLKEWTREFYTERLPKDLCTLQWAVSHPDDSVGGATTRGNEVFSKANVLKLITKPCWIALGGLRSFPCQQMRKLVCALIEDSLQLDHLAVQVVLRQAVYHVGELTDEARPALLWKRDLFHHDGLQALREALLGLVDKYRSSPNKHPCFRILGEVSAFFSQFEPDLGFGDPSRFFSDVAQGWADDIDNCIRQSSQLSTNERFALRSRESLMVGYAILGLSRGPISSIEGRRLVRLNVRFCHGLVFSEDAEADTKVQVNALRVSVISTMASRWESVVGWADNECLTASLRIIVEWAPTTLEWSAVKSTDDALSLCFVAEDSNHNQFSIDVYAGRVLVNGAPPGRLPLKVIQHPLYQRNFGESDFEVVASGQGYVTRTALRCKDTGTDYFYFFGFKGGNLVVREIESASNEERELVNFEGRCSWWVDLPIRLKEHSHWLFVQGSDTFVQFRGVNFQQKATDYFVWHSGSCSSSGCYEVPHQLKKKRIQDICTDPGFASFKSFVCVDSGTSSVMLSMAKFELMAYVHTTVCNSEGFITYSLPRFGLTFEQSIEGGDISCNEHSGFKLAYDQQLENLLPWFDHYLVLENVFAATGEKPEKMLLVPYGTMARPKECMGFVRVILPLGPNENIKSFNYDQHPWTECFQARTISSRLHWASVLATSGSYLPDALLGMTGLEAAIEAVEQCVCYSPLDSSDYKKLAELILTTTCEPWLVVRCGDLWSRSNSLFFLHEGSGRRSDPCEACKEAINSAMSQVRQWMMPMNVLRRVVSKMPGLKSFHSPGLSVTPYIDHKQLGETLGTLPAAPVDGHFVHAQEVRLQKLFEYVDAPPIVPPFPLKAKEGTELSRSMTDELESSWNHHHKERPARLLDRREAQEAAERIRTEVRKSMELQQSFLFGLCSTETLGSLSAQCLALRAANLIPCLTFKDLLRVACDRNVVSHINPLLVRPLDRQAFQTATRTLLAMCVLRERVGRVITMLCSNQVSEAVVIRELQICREWNVEYHPEWLVFEVETRLQIRPEQYSIAQFLLDHSGSVVQLNMGLGKTRVIIPMLIMHLAGQADKDRKLVRVVVLNSLLREAVDYLHGKLTASVLGMHLSEMPFRRDVKVNVESIERMKQVAADVVYAGGFQVVAPEHVLSLKLKLEELNYFKEVKEAKALQSLFKEIRMAYILDESDVLLSHRYQLVYAMGSAQALDDGNLRWDVAHALLRVIVKSAQVRSLLERKNLLAPCLDNDAFGCFPQVFLADKTRSSIKLRIELYQLLMKELILKPPHQFLWITDLKGSNMEDLIKAVIDPSSHIAALQLPKDPEYRKCVLALRGFLAHGILEHALNQRYRVSYGLTMARVKRLAVPFRAADVPQERSEFSHPDVAIMLTTLAYYYHGLSLSQMREAALYLMRMSQSARSFYYCLWFEQIRGCSGLPSEQLASIDHVDKIDVTNAVQIDLIHHVYWRCTETINFWLAQCVFPTDTPEYSERTLASPWELGNDGSAVGFSGTNDNHRLLPLHVEQRQPDIISLLATNGHMLHHILHDTVVCAVLKSAGTHGKTRQQLLVDMCAGSGARALIDAGALLAGVSNASAALMLLDSISVEFQGVYYFDPDHHGGVGRWMVLSRSTRTAESSQCSPIREWRAFVLFDDARCRGADMRLPSDALALLTVGFGVCKDKLMQGAGRMRLLGRGQKLHLIIPTELLSAVEAADTVFDGGKEEDIKSGSTAGSEVGPTISSRKVLEWVMANTVAASESGILQWAWQGLVYTTKSKVHEKNVINDDWALSSLYAPAEKACPISDQVAEMVGRHITSVKTGFTTNPDRAEIGSVAKEYQAIHTLAERWGRDVLAPAEKSEECEWEMQLEREVVEESEKELLQAWPAKEERWDFSQYVLLPQSLGAPVGPGIPEILSLSSEVARWLRPEDLQRVRWEDSRIWCTRNFFRTALQSEPTAPASSTGSGSTMTCMNEYLRPIDMLLTLPSGDVLILSDAEADGILRQAWTLPRSSLDAAPMLMNLAMALRWLRLAPLATVPISPAAARGDRSVGLDLPVIVPCSVGPSMAIGGVGGKVPSDASLAAARIFNGDTAFSTRETRDANAMAAALREAARGLLADPSGRDAVKELVGVRGRLNYWVFSDLEILCDELRRIEEAGGSDDAGSAAAKLPAAAS